MIEFKDKIFTNIDVHLSFIDRLKVLFGKTIFVEVETDTENKPGKCESTSIVKFEPFIKYIPKNKCQLTGI